MQITKQQLKSIMPKAGDATINTYLPLLNKYMAEFGINTRLRVCHYLAQIAVESNELTATSENLNYSAEGLLKTFPRYFNAATAKNYARQPQRIANHVYANRLGNGNEASGDGWKYRGRGLIQLTGKSNYNTYRQYCGYDVVAQPDLLALPLGATRSSGWYWATHQLNLLADKDDLQTIRKRINGGTNGLSAAKLYLLRAKAVIK